MESPAFWHSLGSSGRRLGSRAWAPARGRGDGPSQRRGPRLSVQARLHSGPN